jgi:hypothetical protein
MGMKRSVLLAGSFAALQVVACGSDGLQATVGVIASSCADGVACDAGARPSCEVDGSCTTGSDSGANPDATTPVARFVFVTPTVEPLSETAVRIRWATAPGSVSGYEVRIATSRTGTPVAVASLAQLAPSTTSAVVSDLTPGTLGRVVVAATVAAIDPPPDADAGVASSVLWTPFGAINEDSVSSVTPLAGYGGPPYAEGMFVSANFSMFFAQAYLKESSFVFAGRPASPVARPVYNFASPVIQFANGFTYPDVTDVLQIWSDGASKVLLANQSRVLVYDHLPLTADVATPDRILGQESWTGMGANDGQGTTNARGVGLASGACFNGTTLYVRDGGNNRILGWHGWPTQMGQAADFVLGQPDFVSSTANNGGISKGTLDLGLGPGSTVDCRGARLAVTDTANHRVLVWNTAPTRTGVPADVVLGQFSGNQSDQGGAGGLAVGGMLAPASVAMLDGGGGRTAIVVSDASANRVVEWDDVPTMDGAPFNRVYGQPDANTVTANTGGLSAGSLSNPSVVSVDDENRFWVADFNNGRALRFDLDSPTAIDVFGQRSGTSAEFFPGSYSTTRYAWNHWEKGQMSLDPASGLLVTTSIRAMIWDTPPTNGAAPVSAIQGQPDATSAGTVPTSPTSISAFCSAVSVGATSPRVYWSDSGRILSKPGTFTADDSVPDIVLGDQDFQGNVVAPTTLDYAIQPTFLATDGQALLAVDGARIVGWREAPRTSNVPIDFAIGQPTLLVNAASSGTVTARSLGGGRNAMTIADGRLIVADPGNQRVLIWNSIPVATGAPADLVLGQPDFTSSMAGSGLASMNAPGSVAVLDGKLFVSDTGNGRLLVFDPVPAASGVAATTSWDPREARFSLPAWFNAQELAPRDLGAYAGRLYIGQTSRILVVPDFF